MLGDSIVDAYMWLPTRKEMWDALEAKYGVYDAGSGLYIMEQFYDYKMIDGHYSIVEQIHEIQTLAKELANIGCVLPDKFVVACIFDKLPQTWTYFSTFLKHKRQEFDIADLIGCLDVEEKGRAKDVRGKKIIEGSTSAYWYLLTCHLFQSPNVCLYLLTLLYQVVIPSDDARDACWYYLVLLLEQFFIILCDQKECIGMKVICKCTNNYTIVALHLGVFQVSLFIFLSQGRSGMDMY